MRVADLDYDLPASQVAQVPPARREDARLLVVRDEAIADRSIGDLPELLQPGDLLVVNDTRVLAARLAARRATGGAVSVLALGPASGAGEAWEALLGSGGTLRAGEVLEVGGDGTGLRLLGPLEEGRWRVEGVGADVRTILERHGRMPLPPYVRRDREDPRDDLDRERYQTVFAREAGAVAAPTAGLHLTAPLLDRCRARGVEIAPVTLHVGLGTFAPVRVESFEDHDMHEEAYVVPEGTAAAWVRAREAGGRVVAVGTTVVRALESAALRSPDGRPVRGADRTRLLVLPGFAFRAVDLLLTNFHLPRSTLLALVCAFAGTERVLAAYREAVRRGYRFFSYGDATLLTREAAGTCRSPP